MPIFEFTSPEGRVYEVTGPEGATKEQAWGILQQQISSLPAQEAPETLPSGLNLPVNAFEQFAAANPEVAAQNEAIAQSAPLLSVALPIASKGPALARLAANALTEGALGAATAEQGQAGKEALIQGATGAVIPEAIRPIARLAKSGLSHLSGRVEGATNDIPIPESTVGASQVSQGELRQAQAGELPVPIKLTKGQRERGLEQVKFEQETAKQGELGKPLREVFADQNRKIAQNLDAFIDSTGAQSTELRDIGYTVDKALRNKAKIDKKKIDVLYNKARDAGELEQPVELDKFVNHLNESTPEAEVANVLKAVRAKAIKLGAATEDAEGNLVPGKISLNDAELLRRTINNATNAEPTNIRQAAIMKGLIDDQTEGLGGNLYKQARRERAKYANTYENVGLAKKLLNTKRGTNDRQVALEDVLHETVFKSPLDTLKQVARTIKKTKEGQQAWREIQGGTLQAMRDHVLGNMQIDEVGNRIISPAKLDKFVTGLDKSGKLDYLFGTAGAQKIRTINDVAKTLNTFPPGSVNYSNTSSALLEAMDFLIGGAASGIPGLKAPVAVPISKAVKYLKTRELRKRINEAIR